MLTSATTAEAASEVLRGTKPCKSSFTMNAMCGSVNDFCDSMSNRASESFRSAHKRIKSDLENFVLRLVRHHDVDRVTLVVEAIREAADEKALDAAADAAASAVFATALAAALAANAAARAARAEATSALGGNGNGCCKPG